jgi:UDP-N-acetylmuramyl tripeptide synthase
VPSPTQPLVIIDYAHTPDALARADGRATCCQARGELWRYSARAAIDDGKRVDGRQAAAAADAVVVTSDNPRTEDPQQIIGTKSRSRRCAPSS